MAYRMRSNVCMDSEAGRPLPLEICGTLSPSVQEYIQALQVQVQQLEGQVKELEARLGQNSQTSSRPPSSDSPRQKGPKKDKTPSGRGGQPGHPAYRSLPPEPPGGLPAAEGPLASRDQPGRTVLPGGSYRRSSGPGNGRGSPGDPGSGVGEPG